MTAATIGGSRRRTPRARSGSDEGKRSWKLEAGSWKLEAGSWKLEAGSRKRQQTT
jgi:hypothetical protein